MKGAVESLKGDLSGLRTGRRQRRAARSGHGHRLWCRTRRSIRWRRFRHPNRACSRCRCGTSRTSGPSKRRSARPASASIPINDGNTLRLPIPDLTEDRRKELAKLASQYSEKAKIAIRNVRRDGMDALKADENKKEISEDERKRLETELQKLTDEQIKAADDVTAQKEKEILGK